MNNQQLWPLVEVAIEPRFGSAHASLCAALDRLAAGDPSLRVSTDAESGQIILGSTIGEKHLDLAIDNLRREHGIEFAVGAPQVAYRETLTRRVEMDYTHKKQISGAGQFARVKIIFVPDATATGTAFGAAIEGGAVPAAFIAAVEVGIAAVARSGILAGFPVVGVRATLIDGAYHDVDSSAQAFEVAARAAFREALREGDGVLLDPIMRVEVTAPEDYRGAIAQDLDVRGHVQGEATHGEAVVVTAFVSLANLFGYENKLHSLTQGRGTFEMRFDHHRPVPPRGDDWPPPAVAAALRA